MPDYYSEPFITLAGLTHKSALISWGAFYFKVKNSGEDFKLVEDGDLEDIKEVIGDSPDQPRRVVHPPRKDSIGATSQTYGPARVVVKSADGTIINAKALPGKNHCLVHGLKSDTEYTYTVFVNSDGKEREWAEGDRRNWERRPDGMGLGPKSKKYDNRFRTFPDPSAETGRFSFVVIGDFGVGVKKDKDRGQRQVAAALERAVNDKNLNVRFMLTTGDNIYRSGGFFGLPIGGDTGDEDDDWYFTYYQPYRYIINRLPVFPTIGNHDSPETEGMDDREQLFDNFYVRERLGEEAGLSGHASVDPGLFYRFRFGAHAEFICLDTSTEKYQGKKTQLFNVPHHKEFLERVLAADGGAPRWRIPFGHHPPYCHGPKYGDTPGMGDLVDLFKGAGVRLVLSGHDHFFQHNRHEGIDYFVTGGAGRIRDGKLKGETVSKVQSWASEYHFLLVTIDGKRATVRAIAATEGDALVDIPRKNLDKKPVTEPMVIDLP